MKTAGQKIVITLIVLLVLVILGEVGYYFYLNNFQSVAQTTQQVQNQAQNQTQTVQEPQPATQGLSWSNPRHIDKLFQGINPNLAIDGKVLQVMMTYNDDILESSIITNTHKGKIQRIEKGSSKAYFDYYEREVLITITGGDSTKFHSFELSKEDLQNTIFVAKQNDEEVAITIDDLHLGDTIIVEETIDATKKIPAPSSESSDYTTKSWGYNRIKVKIIKI